MLVHAACWGTTACSTNRSITESLHDMRTMDDEVESESADGCMMICAE